MTPHRRALLVVIAMLATVLLVTILLPTMGQGYTNYEDAEPYPAPDDKTQFELIVENPILHLGIGGAVAALVVAICLIQRHRADEASTDADTQ